MFSKFYRARKFRSITRIIFGAFQFPIKCFVAGEAWIKQNQAKLDDANLKKGLKLFWVGIGKDDFLLSSSRGTVELLKKHGFTPVSHESDGGHTWINWRNYLNQFAPQLFQTKTAM